jgi:glycosyltransferase involved in cell wall biosynthesis
MVAPMQTGGGIQNKVLEGMALARANILSPLAAAPMLGAQDRLHFITAETPLEYADAIHMLARSVEVRELMGESARNYIKDNFTWTVCFKAYEDVIKKVINHDC